MRKVARAAGVAVAAGVLLAGCGDSGGDQASDKGGSPATESTEPSSTPSSEKPKKNEPTRTVMEGAWKSITDSSPIDVIAIAGDQVTTVGEMDCPGSLEKTGANKARITLDCPESMSDPSRETGTVELKPDGSHLIIEWDGQEWGGMIDSFTPTKADVELGTPTPASSASGGTDS